MQTLNFFENCVHFAQSRSRPLADGNGLCSIIIFKYLSSFVKNGDSLAEVHFYCFVVGVLGHFLCHLAVSVLSKTAIAAAGGAVPGVFGIHKLTAQHVCNFADGLLGALIAPGAAGVVHGGRPVKSPGALRQADLAENIPYSLDLYALVI